MALKTLLLRSKLDAKRTELEGLRAKDADFATREADLEAAIGEAATEEERAAVETMVGDFEAEHRSHLDAVATLEGEISDLEEELRSIEAAAPKAPASTVRTDPTNNTTTNERKDDFRMKLRSKRFRSMTAEQRSAFVELPEVNEFLERFRAKFGVPAAQQRSVTGAELNIPTVILDMVRENVADYSKLLRRVNLVSVDGTARQTVMGTIPEAVWTEMCATLNELDFAFNQVEVDGYKLGGVVAICNSSLKDSIGLADAIIVGIQQAIGIGLDKAILYGKGTKMPLGIATRLAQTAKPSDYPANARPWEDLHETNVIAISSSATGVAFFQSFLAASAKAKGRYSRGVKFWAMNEASYTKIKSEALSINAAGAVVADVNGVMPVVGGDIEVFDDNIIPDNTVIGGYGDLYLLAEREGASVDYSEHARFIQDQTVFRGVARYDGLPVIAEGFVALGLGAAPVMSVPFDTDKANSAPSLAALKIGNLSLTPAFDGDTTEYSASTTAASNVINVTANAGDAVLIEVNGVAVANGGTATWTSGANTVTVAVSNSVGTKVYTVAVTKS